MVSEVDLKNLCPCVSVINNVTGINNQIQQFTYWCVHENLAYVFACL